MNEQMFEGYIWKCTWCDFKFACTEIHTAAVVKSMHLAYHVKEEVVDDDIELPSDLDTWIQAGVINRPEYDDTP